MTQSTDVKNFTRGGQITLHNIRMFFQIMDKVTWIAAGIFLSVTLSSCWVVTTQYERYVFGEYLWSTTMPILNPTSHTQFIQPNGSVITVKYSDIHESVLVKDVVRNSSMKIIRSIFFGLFISIISFYAISRWLKKTWRITN